MKKDDPAEAAAAVGFKAMTNGDVAPGWKRKLISAVANVTPSPILAAFHRSGASRALARSADNQHAAMQPGYKAIATPSRLGAVFAGVSVGASERG